MNISKLPTLFLLSISLVSTATVADIQPDLDLYAAFNLTNHKVHGAATDGCATFGTKCDGGETGFRGAAGLTYKDRMSIEASYFHASGYAPRNSKQEDVTMTGAAVTAVARVKVSDTFYFKPKLGVVNWNYKHDDSDHDGQDLLYGVGFEVKLGDNLGANFGGERFHADGDEIHIYYGGILYTF